MKKVALSLAGVLAAVAFAPEASAIPSFARQTGMACSSCHFQHFPVLNGFGRAFKTAGFTMMGAQEKVEGEHLSIPGVLNASVLVKAQYVKTNDKSAGNPDGMDTSTGQIRLPDELSLFLGGRVADADTIKVGFMMENNLAAPGSALIAGFRLPIVLDMDAVKISAIPFTTDSLGVGYGFELAATGMNRGVRWAEHRKDALASQYVGLDGAAAGLALVVANDMGYINFSRWTKGLGFMSDKNPDVPYSATGMAAKANYLRVAATPTIADWSMHIAVGMISGTDEKATNAGLAAKTKLKATAFDVQAQGAVAGMETSLYLTNASNGDTNAVKATTIGGEVTVIPHAVHLGAAYRAGKTAASLSDNAVLMTATYDLAQNVAGVVNYSIYSGDVNKAPGATNKLTLMLESAW